MENLKKKYGIKLIVFVSIFDLFDIKKEDYIKYTNQLLELNYESIVEVKILTFENYHFQLRIPTIDELITYINEDSQINDIKEVKKYSNNNTLKKVKIKFYLMEITIEMMLKLIKQLRFHLVTILILINWIQNGNIYLK